MKGIKLIGFLVICVISFSAIAQESINNSHLNNDVGVFFNVPNGQPSFEFRKVINDNYKLRLGLDHIAGNGISDVNGVVVFASDSLVVLESANVQTFSPTFRIGIDRQLPTKWLSVGGDLVLRYTNEKTNYFQSAQSLTENGWEFSNDKETILPPFRGITNHFMTAGLRANLSANFPLGEQFMLTAYYAAEIGAKFFLTETNRTDPQNIIPTQSGYSFEYQSFFGLGVRYILKSKESR